MTILYQAESSDNQNMMENHDKNCLVEYYVSGVCILLVSVMGVSANILSSIVLKTRQIDTNQTLRNLLVWLAMVDSVFLVMLVMVFSLPHFSSYYRDFLLPYIVPSVLPCTSGAMTGNFTIIRAVQSGNFSPLPEKFPRACHIISQYLFDIFTNKLIF